MTMKKLKDIPTFAPLKEEFHGFTSVRLIHATRNVLEKILWISIAIVGTIWIGDLFINQVNFWNENPVLATKGTKALSEITAPAVTFCHKGVLKYSLVENLVNILDVNKTIPSEIFQIRNEAIKINSNYLQKRFVWEKMGLCALSKNAKGMWTMSSHLDDKCEEFSKKLYIFSMKSDMNFEQVHDMIFDLIEQQKLMNLTEAILMFDKALDFKSDTSDSNVSSPTVQFLKQIESYSSKLKDPLKIC